MMGVGKSRVAEILAEGLGWPFIDLDAGISEAAGMPVAEIFGTEGEDGFRARERAAVAALDAGPAVIALGGGTILEAENRARLERLGPVVCLTATPETLARRLAADPRSRPLLAPALVDPPPGAASRAFTDQSSESATRPRVDRGYGRALTVQLADLLAARQPIYDSIALQVDTEGRGPERVADEVLRLLVGSPRLSEGPIRSLACASPPDPADRRGRRFGYGTLIGPGLLASLGDLMRARGLDGRVLVVTDQHVGPLYADKLLAGLADAGIEASLATMGVGEPAKTLATVDWLYSAALEAKLDRQSCILALGGGVVGDTAGLLAASWMRGISLVQAPTSLLAMVDASVGGKVGVNLPAGKNLVGAFHHPALVLADTSLLASLPERERIAGLAEVVKSGLIGDPGLLGLLEAQGAPAADAAEDWAELVYRALSVKAALVREDPGERGRRAELNLGHTFAHALEHCSDYRISHGEAVAIGLVAAARLAEQTGIARLPQAARIERLLRSLGLPVRFIGLEPEALIEAMSMDKKRRDGRLRFVLPIAPGEVGLVELRSPADLLGLLQGLRGDAAAAPGRLESRG
jgi:3-dehydroquinate synthase